MFGYVVPAKSELKIKDYEKFKAYYCGLCLSIKKNYGNLPRAVINYDMTFLAILLDSLDEKKCEISTGRCIVHPLKKRLFIVNNSSIDYAAFFNITLAYFKLTDDVNDDNSKISRFNSFFLKTYLRKIPESLTHHSMYIKEKLNELYYIEASAAKNCVSIDEISDSFAKLTGFILSAYPGSAENSSLLYDLGYNLGKWIYIIDAYDDLEDDMKKSKFNAINCSLNKNRLSFSDFNASIKNRIDFLLVTCARNCFECLDKMPLKTNKGILYNVLQLGLLEKMETVFNKASVFTN